jgi:hypothetical protein
MSDAPTDAPVEAAESPDTGASAPDPAGIQGSGDEVNLDADIPPGINRFDRAYVEKLRGEAAKHRTTARDAQQQLEQYRERYGVFDGYDDADLNVWRDLAQNWSSDPRTAAETMRTIATNVLGDPTATPQEKAEAQQQLDDIDQASSPEDINKIIEQKLSEHQQQLELDSAVAKIESTLTDAGYEKGTMPYSAVLWFASNDPDTGGDVGKAMEKFEQYRQSVIDDYVQSVKGGKIAPRGPQSNGQPAVPSAEISSVKDATAATRAFLADRGRA